MTTERRTELRKQLAAMLTEVRADVGGRAKAETLDEAADQYRLTLAVGKMLDAADLLKPNS